MEILIPIIVGQSLLLLLVELIRRATEKRLKRVEAMLSEYKEMHQTQMSRANNLLIEKLDLEERCKKLGTANRELNEALLTLGITPPGKKPRKRTKKPADPVEAPAEQKSEDPWER